MPRAERRLKLRQAHPGVLAVLGVALHSEALQVAVVARGDGGRRVFLFLQPT